jgi:hypothetical protein
MRRGGKKERGGREAEGRKEGSEEGEKEEREGGSSIQNLNGVIVEHAGKTEQNQEKNVWKGDKTKQSLQFGARPVTSTHCDRNDHNYDKESEKQKDEI